MTSLDSGDYGKKEVMKIMKVVHKKKEKKSTIEAGVRCQVSESTAEGSSPGKPQGGLVVRMSPSNGKLRCTYESTRDAHLHLR